MDPELVPIPQSETKPARPFLSRSEILLRRTLLLIAVLILTAISGFLAYQNLQLKKQITRLTNQIKDVGLAPEPIPTEFQTANWKTYTNNDYGFSFKYPPEIKIKEDMLSSEAISRFTSSKKPLTLYLEEASGNDIIYINPELPLTTGVITTRGTKEIADINVTYETYGDSTTHFSNFNINELPNFSIDTYKSSLIVDQILSTFKFLDQSTDTPTSTSYTCPLNGYVDCMPNPNAGIRFECTSEAFTWYKANCPNFQGGAL